MCGHVHVISKFKNINTTFVDNFIETNLSLSEIEEENYEYLKS